MYIASWDREVVEQQIIIEVEVEKAVEWSEEEGAAG